MRVTAAAVSAETTESLFTTPGMDNDMKLFDI
jgi:hypothetical protein